MLVLNVKRELLKHNRSAIRHNIFTSIIEVRLYERRLERSRIYRCEEYSKSLRKFIRRDNIAINVIAIRSAIMRFMKTETELRKNQNKYRGLWITSRIV